MTKGILGRMPLKPSARPRTAEETAAAELREAIVRGDLPPGAAIRQDATARELGVSVIPVREALKTLASEGLIVYRPQRGYTVAQLHPESLGGIYRVRELLEGEAERTAVGRVTGRTLEHMLSALRAHAEAARSGDVVEMIAANGEFHFALFDLCDNPLLLRYVRQTWDTLDPHRALAFRRSSASGWAQHGEEMRAEHQAIVDALASGAVERAAQLLRAHRGDGHAAFVRHLGLNEDAGAPVSGMTDTPGLPGVSAGLD
jgi:DNA-binding GntR family transcriptional regulator